MHLLLLRVQISYSIGLTRVNCLPVNNFADFPDVLVKKKNLDSVQSMVAFGISNISYLTVRTGGPAVKSIPDTQYQKKISGLSHNPLLQ